MGEGLQTSFDGVINKITEISAQTQTGGLDNFKSVLSKIEAEGKKAQAAINGVYSALKKIDSGIKGAFSKLSNFAKSLTQTSHAAKGSEFSLSKALKMVLRYGLGIRSVYVLINRLRRAIVDGFKNLAQYSAEVDQSISMLRNSLNQTKNSFAAMIAPVFNAVAPALNYLIQLCIRAVNAINQLLSALTGGSTWIRAKELTEDYAASLNKAGGAAKKLKTITLGIDELNINAPDDSGGAGGGSGAETSAEDMFETLPIDEKFKDWSEKIKSMWEEADFTDLGASVGERIKNALDNIPWDSIKEKAGKIGSSLATLINGAVGAEGLGYSVGSTLAQAVNTGFAFLNSFVHEIHADSVGKFLAETINGITESIEWDVIYDTFTTAAHKIAELVNNFFSPENLNYESISSTISNLVNTVVDSLCILITETEWADIGKSFGKTLSDAWAGIDWGKAGETAGEAFKAFFDFIGNAIAAVDWKEVGRSVKDFLVGIDWGGVAESFFKTVGAAVGGLVGFLAGLFEGMGGDIVHGLLFGISDKLGDIANWIWEHVFTPFIDGFREAFGIASPSTVMEEMGTYIIEGLFNGITSLIGSVTETWENMKATAVEIWDSVKESLSKTWDSIRKTATDVFEGLKKSISGIWEGLWANIKGTINSILGGVEGMANGVVSGINSVVRALNSLHFDIPDWIPGGLGGKTFGFSIPELGNISIPRLAAGGLVTQYTPAVIGEAGMEAVLPLTNRRTMGMIADSILENTDYGQGGFNGDIKGMIREAVHEELSYLMGALAPYLGDISQNTREAAEKDMSFSLDGREFISAVEETGERLGFNFRSGGSRSRGMF